MKSLKAVLIGVVFVVIAILFLQLIYLFVAVAYNSLAQDYPFLNDIAGSFRYIIGIPVFIVTMFIGGFITAYVAQMKTKEKVWMHCIAVGLITSAGMIYPTLETASITTTGIVIFILSILATAAGGSYWQKTTGLTEV